MVKTESSSERCLKCTTFAKQGGYFEVICDAIKQNESELKNKQIMPQYQSFIMLKIPSKLSIRFQKYSHFSDARNNKIQ